MNVVIDKVAMEVVRGDIVKQGDADAVVNAAAFVNLIMILCARSFNGNNTKL